MKKNYKTRSVGFILFILLTLSVSNTFAQVTPTGSNEYGRLFDLVYDQGTENKIYALSMKNHILVSLDNGVSWDVLYSLPTGYIRDMRLVNNSHLSFGVFGDYTPENNTLHLLELSTLRKTTINRPINRVTNVRYISGYDIFKADPSIMLYHETYQIGNTSYDRVYRTTDGGIEWNVIYDEIDNDEIPISTVLINPTNENHLFLGRGFGPNDNDSGLWVSYDASVSWTKSFTQKFVVSISIDPFNNDHWIIGDDPQQFEEPETVYETFDAGEGWSEIPIQFDDFSQKRINKIVFHPVNEGEIMILETNEIAITTDFGEFWSVQVYNPFNTDEYFYGLGATYNPFNNVEVIITSNWYPFRSIDSGINLTRISSPYFDSDMVGVSPSTNSSDNLDSYLYYSVQRGLVSKNLNTGEETTFGIESIDVLSGSEAPNYIVDQKQYGRLFSFAEGFSGQNLNVSADHGQTFTSINQTFFDQPFDIEPDPINQNEIWTSYRDQGTNIIDFSSMPSSITSVRLPTNNGHFSTWIDSSNNQNVLIGVGGEVWNTTDRGINWTNVSTGLTLDPVSAGIFQIAQNTMVPNEFLIGSTSGIWKSIDQFGTWQNVSTASNIRNIKYNPNNSNIVVAATYESQNIDTAILYSTDAGDTWTTIPSSLFENNQSGNIAFKFTDNGITAYLAIVDLGPITFDISIDFLGLDSIAIEDLVIYPNPVIDYVNIEIKNGEIPTDIVIYSITGLEVKRFENMKTVDISDLTSGTYFIRISNGDRKHIVKKVIKK
jgi:photosystem II stability/assembly factor-like uncharacterized protein